jgi:hypothetical protein
VAGAGAAKTGGRQAGTPNKIGADVRAMVLAALERAGGEDYLLEQATANPRAFLTLLGRIIPTQVTGKDDAPLIPESASDLDRVTGAFLAVIKTLPETKVLISTEVARGSGMISPTLPI